MNAPATAAAVAFPKPTLEVVPIGRITASTTHIQELRRARFDKKALQELADSIKQVGVLQPIVVRPLGLGDKYELVCGERRWLAAKLAGVSEIRASVCVLTPEQVLEVQLVENLQREGLHELEEAEGYEELMKLKKITADEVGDMVGKSRSYVYARTKLLALCPEARTAFYADEIDASKALLIARIGHHDTQRQALKDVTKGENGHEGAMSYREAHQHILRNYMLALKSAPFDIKDAALLPKAGDCIKCPKRTGNQADLFGDVKNADVCTDPKCFDDKRQAHYAVARKKLEAAGRKVIYGAEAKKLLPHWDAKYGGNDYIKGEYVLLTASEYVGGRYQPVANVLGKDYVPTLIQHPGTGKMIEVAPRSTIASKASAKAKERKSSGGGNAANSKAGVARANKTDKARQAEEKIKGEVCAEVFTAVAKKITAPGQLELQELAHYFAMGDANLEVVGKALGTKKATTNIRPMQELLKKLKGPQLLKAIYMLWLSQEQNSSWSPAGNEYADIKEQLARYKVDPKKIEKEVRARLVPKPVDKVNAAIDQRAAKGKGKLKSAWPFPTASKFPAKKTAKGKKK